MIFSLFLLFWMTLNYINSIFRTWYNIWVFLPFCFCRSNKTVTSNTTAISSTSSSSQNGNSSSIFTFLLVTCLFALMHIQRHWQDWLLKVLLDFALLSMYAAFEMHWEGNGLVESFHMLYAMHQKSLNSVAVI